MKSSQLWSCLKQTLGRPCTSKLRAHSICRAPAGAAKSSLTSGITVRGSSHSPFNSMAHMQGAFFTAPVPKPQMGCGCSPFSAVLDPSIVCYQVRSLKTLAVLAVLVTQLQCFQASCCGTKLQSLKVLGQGRICFTTEYLMAPMRFLEPWKRGLGRISQVLKTMDLTDFLLLLMEFKSQKANPGEKCNGISAK